jgi:hypothetical protein
MRWSTWRPLGVEHMPEVEHISGEKCSTEWST